MAALDEIATVAELRKFLRLATDDDLDILEAHLQTAVEAIENYTGRYLLDRDGDAAIEAEAFGLPNGDLQFFIRDAQIGNSQTLTYRAASADAGFERSSTLAVPRDRILIRPTRVIMRAGSDGWPERQADLPFAAAFNVGIEAAKLPETFRTAARFLVRELYESSGIDVDALPEGSILATILAPYTAPAVASPKTQAEVEGNRL